VPRRFTVDDMIAEHKAQKELMRQFIEHSSKGPNKTVVVSHHLPSRRLVSARFWPKDGSDGANGGFASDCDNMICTLEPNLWVHGHTHDTLDTTLWKTRVVCNPAGYRGEWATKYNTFMSSENGLKQAVVTPKFLEVSEL
jgi:Icc-related predicted phosphoesterase